MKKWAIKELNAIDNITFAKTLLSERKDALTYYSPLAKKLSEAIAELNGISESRRQLQEKEIKIAKTEIPQYEATRRLDEIDNAAYQLILAFLNKNEEEFPWDMQYIGEVNEVVYQCLLALGLSPGYPYVEYNEVSSEEDKWFIDCAEER